MIAPELSEEVQRLLAEGRLSQREIAGRLGVSRGTVNAIALGKRPARLPRQSRPPEVFFPPEGPVGRCPTCGGLVHMPCLACGLRAMKMKKTA